MRSCTMCSYDQAQSQNWCSSIHYNGIVTRNRIPGNQRKFTKVAFYLCAWQAHLYETLYSDIRKFGSVKDSQFQFEISIHCHLTKLLQNDITPTGANQASDSLKSAILLMKLGPACCKTGSPMLQQENRDFDQFMTTRLRHAWHKFIELNSLASGGMKPNISTHNPFLYSQDQQGSGELFVSCHAAFWNPKGHESSKRERRNVRKLEGSKLLSKPNLKELEWTSEKSQETWSSVAIRSRIWQRSRYGHGWVIWIWYKMNLW